MAKTIAVTGKGGVGKTTVAGLVVRYLRNNTPGPILAMDADPGNDEYRSLFAEIEHAMAKASG